ncbi:septum formation family protein [Curtobacterium sp. UNCCL17]|nr:septum formation family protein [Curtobacterium sp. UNCCL17]
MRVKVATVGLGVVAMACAALLAGCSQSPDPLPTATPSEAVLNGDAEARQLAVGDCFDAAALKSRAKSAVRSCSSGHQNEVYARLSLGEASTRPDDDHLQLDASKQCLAAFEPYVGRDFDHSAVGYSYLYPSVDAWPAGDHDAVCYLVNHGKHALTRSLRHSKV